jgi:glycosyltransferase involved in cell wall biosynthesis
MRAVVASIVDPGESLGGAWVSTRGLLEALRRAGVETDVVSLPAGRRAGRTHDARRVAAVVRATLGDLPAKPQFTKTPGFRRQVLSHVRATRPDIVLLNGGDLIWLVDALPASARVVVVEHNLEHRLYLDQVRRFRPPLRVARRALIRDVRRLRAFELERLAAAGHAIFLSSFDAQRVGRTLPSLESIVIPPMFGDDPPLRRPPGGHGRLELLMLANLDWWPNRTALEWLRRDVLARLGDRARLHLVGLGTEAAARGDERLVGHGWLASLDPVLDEIDIALGPTVAGGGVSVKVAEMAYRGVPLLARPRALRGLPLASDATTVTLGDAADWVAFLRSDAARRLAATVPPPERAAPFTIEPYVGALADLVDRAARPVRAARPT